MRLTLMVVLGLALGQGPALAGGDEKPARHVDQAGGFSFVPPKGWTVFYFDEKFKQSMQEARQRVEAAKQRAQAAKEQAQAAKQRVEAAGQDALRIAEEKLTDQLNKLQGSSAPPGSAQDIQLKALEKGLESLAKARRDNENMERAAEKMRQDAEKKGQNRQPIKARRDNESMERAVEKMRQNRQPIKDNFTAFQFMGSGSNGPAPWIQFNVEDLRRFKITVNGKPVKATLADLVARYRDPPLPSTQEVADSFRVVAEKKLKTDAGAECVVLVTEFDRSRLRYRQAYYFFDLSPDRKLVVTCNAPAIDKLDAVFEACLKTLRLEKP